MTRLMRPSIAPQALALCLLVVVALAVPSASATVIDRDRFADAFSEDVVDDCGRALHEDFSGAGRTHARVGKGDLRSAFLVHSTVAFTDTFTNPANGRSFTVSGRLTFQETKAVRVSGTVFRFTSVEAGTWRLLDSGGDIVLFDRGNIRTTILFDTLGDNTPGGVFVDLISEFVRGPHPGFTATLEEYCAITDELLGLA